MANHGEVGSSPCCEEVVGAYERRVLASDALVWCCDHAAVLVAIGCQRVTKRR